jgi:hypothetical protein
LVGFWEGYFLKKDANNLLSQLWTWENGDIAASEIHGGDFDKALKSIKAELGLPVKYVTVHGAKNYARIMLAPWTVTDDNFPIDFTYKSRPVLLKLRSGLRCI